MIFIITPYSSCLCMIICYTLSSHFYKVDLNTQSMYINVYSCVTLVYLSGVTHAYYCSVNQIIID